DCQDRSPLRSAALVTTVGVMNPPRPKQPLVKCGHRAPSCSEVIAAHSDCALHTRRELIPAVSRLSRHNLAMDLDDPAFVFTRCHRMVRAAPGCTSKS